MRPIVVYLDTSDFAAMYRAQKGSEQYKVLEQLVTAAESGGVIFGLSYFHFFEFIQAAEAPYKSDRILRIDFLQAICSDWSFPFYEDLTDDSVATQGPAWMPDRALVQFDIETLLSQLRQKFETEGRRHPQYFANRAARRKIRSRTGFKEWVKSEPSALAASNSLDDEIYGGVISSGLLRQYVLGNITREMANLRLRGSALNLHAVYHWYYEQGGNKNPITDWVNEIKADWQRRFEALHDQILNNRVALKKVSAATRGLESMMNSEFPLARRDAKRMLKESRRTAALMRDFNVAPLDFSGASLFGRSVKLEEQFRSVMSQLTNSIATNRIRLERSLITDAMHALYLPFCDLWRGDNRFSRLLIEGRVANHHKVVTKLIELPARISLLQETK